MKEQLLDAAETVGLSDDERRNLTRFIAALERPEVDPATEVAAMNGVAEHT